MDITTVAPANGRCVAGIGRIDVDSLRGHCRLELTRQAAVCVEVGVLRNIKQPVRVAGMGLNVEHLDVA